MRGFAHVAQPGADVSAAAAPVAATWQVVRRIKPCRLLVSAVAADRVRRAPSLPPATLSGPQQWEKQMTQQEFTLPERARGETSSTVGRRDWQLSDGWRAGPNHKSLPQLWALIRQEAQQDADGEPALASSLHTTILAHPTFGKSMAFLLANKLSSRTLLGTQLQQLVLDAYEDEPDILDACVADLQAVYERDPACDKYTHCMLYFKGFQAIQCYRVAHWLLKQNRLPLAVALQSRISEVLHVDIHPAAQLGRGLMIDHATGVVIGETAVIGDNVSMLHSVTLGGSGTGRGVRHPHIGHGVLLGAGVCVLGPVTLGVGSKVGAGSVVVTDLPCHSVAVGVPARVIKQNIPDPCIRMDQCADFILDYVI